MAEGVGGPAGVVGDLGLGPRGELQPEHGRPVSLLGQESRLRKIILYKYFFGKLLEKQTNKHSRFNMDLALHLIRQKIIV